MNIRKICFALVLVFSLSMQVFASEKLNIAPETAHGTNIMLYRPIRTNYSIGLWGGINYSKTLFNEAFNVGSAKIVKSQFRVGPSFGISGSLQKSKKWSFQADFIVEQKGMYYEDISETVFYAPGFEPTTFSSVIKSNSIFNYLSVPIVAKRHIGRVVKWYIEAGACFSYLKTAKVKGEYSYDMTSPSGSIMNYKDKIDMVTTSDYGHDVSVLGGFGLIIPVKKSFRGPAVSLILNARYYHGLLNVYKGEEAAPIDPLILIDPNAVVEEPIPPNDGQSIKNMVMNFRIGVVVAI